MLLGAKILALSDAYDTMTCRLMPGARILAVSDAYDAMTSERPYRAAMSDEAACEEIKNGKGTQFDPKVVEAFFRMKEKQARLLNVNKFKSRNY
jgi:HD-GYP domain-containing protein (c-di-GMP phosphodiesterase class II)